MAKVQVLIVEDEAIVSMDLRYRLEGLGYSVPAVISSGEGAVDAASQMRPDLVLMDIKLSGEMDGIDAAARIREQFDIPVVYLTAYADAATLQRAKLTEPYGYLLKPVDPRLLQSVVEVTIYKHQMESRLKESERWLSSVLQSTSDAIVTADRDGKINLINHSAEALLGSNSSQVLGKSLADVLTITGQPSSDHPVTKALSENMVVSFTEETYLVVSEGNGTPISGSAAPIRDDRDNVTGVVLTFRDISERKQAEERLRLLATIVESVDDPIFAIDTEKRITVWNRAAENLYGYSPKEVLGTPVHKLSLPIWKDLEAANADIALNGRPIPIYETQKITKNGEIIDVTAAASPIFDKFGRITGVVAVHRDMTNQKKRQGP